MPPAKTAEPLELTIPLHGDLAALVRPRWAAGQHADAVFVAVRHLEIAVRNRAGSGCGLVGQQLMNDAFTGKLILALDAEEQKGAFFLYAGMMKFIRNAMAHRQVDFDPVEAAQVIGFVDLMVRWLDGDLDHTQRRPMPLGLGDDALLADVDGDGIRERVYLRQGKVKSNEREDHPVAVVVEKQGQLLADWDISFAGDILYGAWLQGGDYDADGRAEILLQAGVGAHSQYAVVLRLNRRGELNPVHDVVFCDAGFNMIDIDGDVRSEAIIGNRLGRLGEPGIEDLDDDIGCTVLVWQGDRLVANGEPPKPYKTVYLTSG